jgi:ABC-type sugar transport system ATPase subunit
MVFQNYALYPHLSVAENIVFGLRVRNVPAAERTRRLADAARMLGLTELLQRKPAQLSGGQRQRVALGRAVVSQAQIVLMDEPLSNLDAKLRQQMREELRGLQQALGLTVIYVTHDQVEAMTMSDRVVVMRRGEVEQSASPIDLYQRPASVTVASFIGSPPMNLLPAACRDGVAQVATTGGPTTVTLPLAAAAPSEVLLGVRAEHLVLHHDGESPRHDRPVPRNHAVSRNDAATHNAPVLRNDGATRHDAGAPGDGSARVILRGIVRVVEYLGADTIAGVDVGLPDKVMARLPGVVRLGVGQPVELAFDPAHVSVFAAATGRRIDDGPARELPAAALARSASAC